MVGQLLFNKMGDIKQGIACVQEGAQILERIGAWEAASVKDILEQMQVFRALKERLSAAEFQQLQTLLDSGDKAAAEAFLRNAVEKLRG